MMVGWGRVAADTFSGSMQSPLALITQESYLRHMKRAFLCFHKQMVLEQSFQDGFNKMGDVGLQAGRVN